MAGIIASVANTSANSLVQNTAKTLLQIKNPTHQRVRVRKVSLLFTAVPATTGTITVRLLSQSAAPTGGASITPARMSPGAETVQTAAYGPGTEPGTSATYDTFVIRPQLGVEIALPLDAYIDVAGGTYFGVQATADQAITSGVTAKIIWEE